MHMHTIGNMTTIGEPATQRDHRDLETSTAQEAILHFRERVCHVELIEMYNTIIELRSIERGSKYFKRKKSRDMCLLSPIAGAGASAGQALRSCVSPMFFPMVFGSLDLFPQFGTYFPEAD